MKFLSIHSRESTCKTNDTPIAKIFVYADKEMVLSHMKEFDPDPPTYIWLIKHIQNLVIRGQAYLWPGTQNPGHFMVYFEDVT